MPYLETLPEDVLDDLEAEANEQIDQRCEQDPLFWVQNCTLTENPKYLEQGVPFKAPFPRKSYFKVLFREFLTSKRILIPKTRDMITSWSGMVWATHQAQWKASFWIVQSMKDAKAQELVEYADILYRNQPEWMKAKYPLLSMSKTEMRWKNGGRILGVPAGEHQIRTYHPSGYIMDECAFLPEAEACWNTVNAAGTPQMIGISSAGPGWMAGECTR